MRPEAVDTAYAALLANFEHQPISATQREQWMRYLASVPEDAFTEALGRCVEQGGSKFSAVPGRRPGVAEFAAIVNAIAADRQRRVQAAVSAEPWGEKDPELASREVRRIREQLRARGARA